jgi:hypothetical protein
MLEKISRSNSSIFGRLETEIVALSDSLVADLKSRDSLKTKLEKLRASEQEVESVTKIDQEIRSLKQKIDAASRQWAQLSKKILKGPEIRAETG